MRDQLRARLTAAGKGFQISYYPHTHQVAFLPPLDNGRYGPLGWDVLILYCSSRQLRFPVWYFKVIYRTIFKQDNTRRIEAEKETWSNKLEHNCKEQLRPRGNIKIHESFTTIIYTFKVSKYIINEQSMNINVFLLFCSFVFLQIERERDRERERERGI